MAPRGSASECDACLPESKIHHVVIGIQTQNASGIIIYFYDQAQNSDSEWIKWPKCMESCNTNMFLQYWSNRMIWLGMQFRFGWIEWISPIDRIDLTVWFRIGLQRLLNDAWLFTHHLPIISTTWSMNKWCGSPAGQFVEHQHFCGTHIRYFVREGSLFTSSSVRRGAFVEWISPTERSGILRGMSYPDSAQASSRVHFSCSRWALARKI